jgi:uncharacterized membrane-anchored protein
VNGKTAGQAIWESLRETAPQEFGDDSDRAFATWDELPAIRRKRMETAAAAVETQQLRLVREDRDQLRKQVLDLAAELEGEAASLSATGVTRGNRLRHETAEKLRKIAEPTS